MKAWWTSSDDQAFRDAANRARFEETIRARLAETLGPGVTVEVHALTPSRPCTHRKCRLARWWNRHSTVVLIVALAWSAVLSTLSLAARLYLAGAQ